DVRTAVNTLELTAPKGGTLTFDAKLRQHLDTALELTKYEAGPAIGIRLSDNFRIGANLFGTYSKRSGLAVFEVDAVSTTGTPPPTAFAVSSQHGTVSELGLVGMVGLQWDPSRALQI